jgi:hypothetical protein
MSPWISEIVVRQPDGSGAFGNYLSTSQLKVIQIQFGISANPIPPLSRDVTINLQILET